jgi:hypothetical protein
MRGCQARLEQSQEAPHSVHLMKKTLRNASKQSFLPRSKKGRVPVSFELCHGF